MKLFREITTLQSYLQHKSAQTTVGFVPTMGALHEGHLSLVKESKARCGLTVCSIFINPTQFNNQEDLVKYPASIENDLKLLAQTGCDVVFYPDTAQMYPQGLYSTMTDYGNITGSMEAILRPGHFDGVVGIVTKLFNIVKPDEAFFGQKDFQQCAVIGELIRRSGLKVKLHICPTIREPDGLALSSRNVRLSKEERTAAKALYQTLLYIKAEVGRVPLKSLIISAMERLKGASPLLRPEYISIVDAGTLHEIKEFDPGVRTIALIAAWSGNVRLIDNMFLSE